MKQPQRLRTTILLVLCIAAAQAAKAQWDFDDDTEFTSGPLRYVVDNDRNAAECRGFAEGQEAAAVTIPATVTRSGHSYSVVSVGEQAFDSAPLTSVTLSEGLRVVRLSAFFWVMTSLVR